MQVQSAKRSTATTQPDAPEPARSILASAAEQRLIARNSQDMRDLALHLCNAPAHRRRIVKEMAEARRQWGLHDVGGWARRFVLALVTLVDTVAAEEAEAEQNGRQRRRMHVIAADESGYRGRFAV